MFNKSPELIQNEHQSYIDKELQLAKAETIKYVNKFLEAEEKWMFINVLLKRLNATIDPKKLCETVSEGVLSLTNSKVCGCCFFSQEDNDIEYKKISYNKDIDKGEFKKYLCKIDSLNKRISNLSGDSFFIVNYFKEISTNTMIAVPILYQKKFLGYIVLMNNCENFYKDNIYFIDIIPEHLALILEKISLYQGSERRNKQKMQFLAGLSHEFKTPLNSIIGFSDILKQKTDDIETYKYIDNISQSSKHLLSLLDDVLDVTKSHFKNLELNYSFFSPKDTIMQVIVALENMCKEKNIELKYTLVDVKITADVKRFKQLIYNLLSNAIKFNKQCGKIKIISYVKDENFFFEIEDTGDGISKKNYDKIFEFFSQVNRNQLKRQLGSGIGLALCKMIVQAHEGHIDFESKIKKGSCFWFRLPMRLRKN